MPRLELPLPIIGLMVLADMMILFVGFFVHVALIFLAAFLVLPAFTSEGTRWSGAIGIHRRNPVPAPAVITPVVV